MSRSPINQQHGHLQSSAQFGQVSQTSQQQGHADTAPVQQFVQQTTGQQQASQQPLFRDWASI